MGVWTDEGFVANKLSDYEYKLGRAFKDAYGEDFDIDPTTPQGILITRIAELLFNTDMDGIEAWSRLNINTITGIYLDLVGAQRGIPRRQGAPQVAYVAVTCSPANFQGFTIAEGTLFKVVGSDDVFVASNSINITTPSATISLKYYYNGNSTASIGTALQVTGYGQITNMQITSLVPGTDAESDMDYRRRLQTEYPAANNTVEWVQNKLMELDSVRDVGCNYNDTATTQGGIPAYCTEWMVVFKDGADKTIAAKDVAQVIINNKVPGSPTYGNTTITVNDMFATPKQVSFTEATEVSLEIEARVTTPEATGFLDLSNVRDIRDNIREYINHLEIGKDVSYSRCAAQLFADPGFDVAYFKIRKLPNAPEWQEGTSYAKNAIVSYNGKFYISNINNNTSSPDSTTWSPYEDGWLENKNYIIGSREYAHIADVNINIGV